MKVDRMPMPEEDRVNPPVWDAPTFLEEVERERHSCHHGAKWEREQLSWREEQLRHDPDAALIWAQRDYGIDKDAPYAIQKLRERAEHCEQRVVEMDEQKEAWQERENLIAEVAFFRNGLQDDESESAIRTLLRRHLRGGDIDDLAEAIDPSDGSRRTDPDKAWEIVEKVNKDSEKWTKRHNSPERFFLDIQHDINGAVWIVINIVKVEPTFMRVMTTRATVVPIEKSRRCGTRARASRGRAVRSPGSRRGSKATARGGGDPPGGSSSGDDPPGLGGQLKSPAEVVA